MSQSANVYPGVRAEPRFLRDPTSLEFISSGLSRFSSYVASNLPKRKSSFPYEPPLFTYHQPPPPPPSPSTPISSSLEDNVKQDVEDDLEKVTYAAFQKMDGDGRSLCLLLGYADGFQVWNIANPDNIHEVCSIRDDDTFGFVSHLHLVANPRKDDTDDAFSEDRPLLAVVTSARDTLDGDAFGGMDLGHTRNESTCSGKSGNSAPSTLRLYSLKTHRVVKEFQNLVYDDEEMKITNIQSNDSAIILGCTTHSNSTLHVLCSRTLSTLSAPITDVSHDSNGPVFSLGSRFLAYATSSPVLNADPVMGQHSKGISGAGLGMLQGDKDVRGAAKDIAKEVVSGVKTLSEYGYNTLSNYFNNQPQGPDKLMIGNANSRAMSPVATRNDERAISPVPSTSSTTGSGAMTTVVTAKKAQPSGMIAIRDVAKLPETPTRNMSPSLVAHFRPHTHPLSCLTFNSAGTLLLSASKQGHSFHIFAIMPSSTTPGNVSHLYTLARGYTDAQVEDCHFSADSMWCSVSTARGTTHVYAINPYGGKPEITGHVTGRVNNPIIRPWIHGTRAIDKGTSISSAARIKQRRSMHTEASDDQHPPTQHPNIPTSPYYPIATPSHRTRYPRAKISSVFLLPSKSPYLVNVSRANQNRIDNSSSSSFRAFKQTASSSLGSMLSSFGSSISSTDSSSSLSSKAHQFNSNTVWTSAHDKLSDNRLFGFDEEELSAVDDDNRLLHDDSTIGYQDMYSIHPGGTLTLHRCWISKSVVRKREQSRTIEKHDLVVKQEDVAEWSMARTTEWEQVKIPLSADTSLQNLQDQPENSRPRRHSRPWLSHAEIMTYANGDELPLWSSVQFSLQTYIEDTPTLRKKLWATGEMPFAEAVVVRRDVPEPYSRRIDRVGKTTTRIANQSEENLDHAVAELEDNLSKAMQTTFSTPSPTTLISGSYGSGNSYKRNSHFLQQPLVPGIARSTPSAVSFEDAHLISMGSGPSPEDLLNLDPRFTSNSRPSNSSIMMPASVNGSLIHFDDDDGISNVGSIKEDVIRLGDEEEDLVQEPVIDQVFSPDGDNEMAYPSESILVERGHHF